MARLITRLARGMYTAEMVAERMEALYISRVSSPNSSLFRASRFSVLLVWAPMIPSLKEEVIMLLSLRVFRWYRRIFFWNQTESSATTGTAARVMRASFRFTRNMAMRLATTAMAPQPRSMQVQDTISMIREISPVSREIRCPVLVLSK